MKKQSHPRPPSHDRLKKEDGEGDVIDTLCFRQLQQSLPQQRQKTL
jgi:hypothetical protein